MSRKAPAIVAGALAALLLALGPAAAQKVSGKENRTGIVQTENGPIKGSVSQGVRKFLGIPYAAPPVANLRWRPPQQPAKWPNPSDAVKFGNSCPQTTPLAGFAAKSDTEDCLYLK